MAGDALVHDHPQGQAPFGGRAFEQAAHLVQHRPRLERLVVQFQLARLDARKVQDVAQQQPQAATRLHGRARVHLAHGGGRVFQQQLQHAHDAVERRAYLVAHVGQEFAFGAVGGLCRLLGAAQFAFGLLAGGTVAHDGQQQRVALFFLHQGHAHLHRQRGAPLGAVGGFERGLAAFLQVGAQPGEGAPVEPLVDVEQAHAQQLFAGVAGLMFRLGVGVQDAAPAVHEIDGVARAFHQHAQPQFAAAQSFFRAALLGDVGDDGVQQRLAVQDQGSGIGFHVAGGAVGQPVAEAKALLLAPRGG